MPLHETARHQRRRDEITFLIMLYSNPCPLLWQLESQATCFVCDAGSDLIDG